MWTCEEVPLPGIRGRLLSELGKKGGRCWGRMDDDCKNCEDCAGGGAGWRRVLKEEEQAQYVEESQVWSWPKEDQEVDCQAPRYQQELL